MTKQKVPTNPNSGAKKRPPQSSQSSQPKANMPRPKLQPAFESDNPQRPK